MENRDSNSNFIIFYSNLTIWFSSLKTWKHLLKLNQNGISGNLLKLLRDFLSYRKQRVVLNGQHSSWDNVNAGVRQGSILGSLLFLT